MEYAYHVMIERNASNVAQNQEALPLVSKERGRNAPGVEGVITEVPQSGLDEWFLTFSQTLLINMEGVSTKLHKDYGYIAVYMELEKQINEIQKKSADNIRMTESLPFLRLAMLSNQYWNALAVIWNNLKIGKTSRPEVKHRISAYTIIKGQISKMVAESTSKRTDREHKALANSIDVFVDLKREKYNTDMMVRAQRKRQHEEEQHATNRRRAD